MLIKDSVKLALASLLSQRLRSFLTALGIAVGIAAVVLLTSIGEGVHKFVLSEFTQFGTNLVAVTPGKATTAGMSGALISNVRPLSISDALAIETVPRVLGVVPFVQGNASVEFRGRSRRTYIFGVGSKVPLVWQMDVSSGRFLPDDDPRAARPLAVLGSTLRQELFGNANPLGRRVRIGGERYRVIGVMASKGQMLGFDLDDAVYIPVARALGMFDRESLMEVDLVYAAGSNPQDVVKNVKRLLMARHGTEDFTITTQEQMLDVLGSVLNILTAAVGAIMTIAVNERTAEIGLLRSIGAHRRQIIGLFMGEAIVLAAIGGFAGLIMGAGGAWVLGAVVPALPTHTPWSYVALAEVLAAVIGLLAGVVPAFRAANLDPIEALRAE
jgi:putative ABC transport system permease protein